MSADVANPIHANTPAPKWVPLAPSGAALMAREFQVAYDGALTCLKRLADAWLREAGAGVRTNLLANLQHGAYMGPSEDPDALETAIALAANEALAQAPWHSYMVSSDRHGPEMALALLRPTSSPQCGRGTTTSLGDFVHLTPGAGPRTGPQTALNGAPRAPDAGGEAAAAVLFLQPGTPVQPSTLGLAVDVNWNAYAKQVLREYLLSVAAEDHEFAAALHLTREFHGGPHALPFRVREAVPAAERHAREAELERERQLREHPAQLEAEQRGRGRRRRM